MSGLSGSLFPEDLFEVPYKWEKVRQAPQKLLEAVGEELGEKSKGVLHYEIKRRVKEDIFLDFYVTAPTLDDYKMYLFTVRYKVNGVGYPVTMSRWDKKTLQPEELSDYGALKGVMMNFLAHKDTGSMVNCLYFHAKNLENID